MVSSYIPPLDLGSVAGDRIHCSYCKQEGIYYVLSGG